MALDKNPRCFILTVTEIDARLNMEEGIDEVEVKFAGKVLPSTKKRLIKALDEGYFTLSEKTLS